MTGSGRLGYNRSGYQVEPDINRISRRDVRNIPSDLSGDGSVVVGEWDPPEGGRQPFRWTSETGMVDLGLLPWASDGRAEAVSADGSIVVGYNFGSEMTSPFIWDEIHGMRDLSEVLTVDFGLDLTDWDFANATDISSDGRIIVGSGRYIPDSSDQAWMVIIPEPSSIAMTITGVIGLLVCAWRRRRRAE